jgi:hypothetical protein
MKLTSQISYAHLPGEHGAEINFLRVEADAPARGHGDGLVMERVVELGQTGIRPH